MDSGYPASEETRTNSDKGKVAYNCRDR